ncbi:MAG: AAA family ATPase [Verrucomicrobia bacterium]|nr:AAA family ATPase [Verrucomicrobiota bacterium]MBU4292384.1 AAA family ATPase [Verrucomicrobiota bacterium]MBU4428213.1 AAA family ATPase [Verrucomicrobiota bacterium]MBU4496702.1 AAA family ATPase [Verrucomicrobiota bacterium]MCG2679112.1 AAA family ATPase [Kiritimatiellia bacterium]
MTKRFHIRRLLRAPQRSFFLFGPRGIGKSTWLKEVLRTAVYVDLLDASQFLELSRDPHALEAMVGNRPPADWVVVDEIQKIPILLDEVHRLMESRQWRFALCGSSARKLRRGGVNLLGGRALTLNMEPFSAAELGNRFDLAFGLQWGMLPIIQFDQANAAGLLSAYVNTYLKEEIREEGLVRKVPPFIRFLAIAGQLNGQAVNGHNIARDASVPRSNVETYFSILDDTLMGYFLPTWKPRLKVREQTHPKFYWFDPGVARAAAGLQHDPADRTWLGTALETLIYHELRVFNETAGRHRAIAYYATAAGTEIDFVVETRKAGADKPAHVICIEVKLAEQWSRKWERPMRDLKSCPGVIVERMMGVYTGPRPYHYDGLDVLPVPQFLDQLHAGKVF